MFAGISKYGKGSVVQMSTVFWSFLRCLLWKRALKWDFTDIYLINIIGDGNLGHISTMRVIFFLKWSKFNVDFKNGDKNWKKVFCFWENNISVGSVKFSLYRRKYLLSSVNVVTNRLKNLHRTNTDFLQLNYVSSDEQIW